MKQRLIGAAAAVCLSILVASPAWAQSDRAKVDGDAWLSSTPEIRKSFLIGAGSMIALDRAYSKRKGTPASVAGTRTAEALENMTLDEVSARITRWYEANPDRRRLPVMAVVWIDIVNPRDRR